jgi:hypothetical protein
MRLILNITSACLYPCLSYPAGMSHLLYAVLCCHLWPHCLCLIFPRYLTQSAIFGKKIYIYILNIKHVFWFSLQSLSETFLILRKIKQDIIINMHVIYLKYPLFLWVFNKTWIFSKDFRKKSSNIKFLDYPSSGSQLVPRGQTDIK